MSITLEQLNSAVQKAVKETVNGKIDRLSTDVKSLRGELKAHVDIVQPIIEQFNDRRGFWNTLSTSSKNVALVGALIAGIGILVAFAKKAF